jgi:hypothetical protein
MQHEIVKSELHMKPTLYALTTALTFENFCQMGIDKLSLSAAAIESTFELGEVGDGGRSEAAGARVLWTAG